MVCNITKGVIDNITGGVMLHVITITAKNSQNVIITAGVIVNVLDNSPCNVTCYRDYKGVLSRTRLHFRLLSRLHPLFSAVIDNIAQNENVIIGFLH